MAGLTEVQLSEMADRDPVRLAQLLASDTLSDYELTFGAEYLGHSRLKKSTVRLVLSPLLNHPHAIVREGALYGLLAGGWDDAVRNKLTVMSESDSSPAIREICRELLE